jgi:hypothetical protein
MIAIKSLSLFLAFLLELAVLAAAYLADTAILHLWLTANT